ncbi:MAG: coenzyme F420-0:L-glutamate ligase [Candidatus Methanomethylicia archaeon]
MKYKVLKIRTCFWYPGTDFINEIVKALKGRIRDNDIITISEKAISTALGYLIDESKIKPSSFSKFLAKVWMRIIWGYILGPLCKLKHENLIRLRNYPLDYGAKHKELVFRIVGVLQTLRHYSEGGIDASNLPYTLVALPLRNANKIAKSIHEAIREKLGVRVGVIIVDGDVTFSWRNIHLAPRHLNVRGLKHFGGFITFIIGRVFKLRERATPVGICNVDLDIDEILHISGTSHKLRRSRGGTIWDTAAQFNVNLSSVTWEMLEKLKHYPIVIFRRTCRSNLYENESL